MNTIGMRTPLLAICSWKARPLSPRSRTSRIRQLGASCLVKARNSCDDSKVSTRRPVERSSPLRASRTASSSSTT
ncbi:hypothetical protein D3C71_2185890 [compost metagenome]